MLNIYIQKETHIQNIKELLYLNYKNNNSKMDKKKFPKEAIRIANLKMKRFATLSIQNNAN